MHELAVARQAELCAENASLRAQLRLREQQLFGKKSEAGAGKRQAMTASAQVPAAKRPRGQQSGKPGPSRRDYSHLPAVETVLELPAEQQRCRCCGLPLEPFAGSEDSEILEVDVKAYRRVIRRRRYRRSCS